MSAFDDPQPTNVQTNALHPAQQHKPSKPKSGNMPKGWSPCADCSSALLRRQLLDNVEANLRPPDEKNLIQALPSPILPPKQTLPPQRTTKDFTTSGIRETDFSQFGEIGNCLEHQIPMTRSAEAQSNHLTSPTTQNPSH